MRTAQVIALLLPDSIYEANAQAPRSGRNATALVRDAEGRMTLEEVTTDNAFMEKMVDTGCFRRGKPIVDPVSRQIMGYEMEMLGPPARAALFAR